MQAVSLAHGGNLSYDAADLTHYDDATWRVRYRPPAGLLFQRDGDGWAFAKPYGYSLVVAPFLRVLGPTRGVAVANTLLLLAVLAVCIALLRLRLEGPAVPLTALAIVLVSNVVPYAYVLYVELFTAVGRGPRRVRPAAGRPRPDDVARPAGLRRGRPGGGREVDARARARPARGGGADPPAGLAGPAARARRRRRSSSGLAVVPYWRASDGQTISPYGGERYTTSGGAVPFSDPPAPENRYGRSTTDETLSVSYVRDALGESWRDKARSAVTYVVGRHTGVLVFMPVAVVIAVLALLTGKRMGAPAIAILGGLALYAVAYVVALHGQLLRRRPVLREPVLRAGVPARRRARRRRAHPVTAARHRRARVDRLRARRPVARHPPPVDRGRAHRAHVRAPAPLPVRVQPGRRHPLRVRRHHRRRAEREACVDAYDP